MTKTKAFIQAAAALGLYPQGDTEAEKVAALIDGGHGKQVSAAARRMFPEVFEPAQATTSAP